MAYTYTSTGGAGADSFNLFGTSGGKPATGSTYYFDGGLGNDTLTFNNGFGQYGSGYISTRFTIAPVDVNGLIVVSGSSSGGKIFTFTLKSVETLVFADKTIQLSYASTVDTTPPTLSITSSASALKIGQTATISFTFSEDPLATFTASDIAVSGGTLTGLTTTGLVRTATFTPTAGLASGTASITVASGSYTDAALNAGGAGTTPSITIDTLAPTVAITSSTTALHAGQTATISFTFSEDPLATFTASDIVVSGGTLSGLTTTGLVRTATFTPTASLASGSASITVASGSYTDAALNAGGAGTTPSITIDTLAPRVAITSSVPTLHAGQTATISFTFSEDPLATFSASDIAVSGGTLSGLTTTGLVRTATFTPTAGLASGTASITVASGSYTDAALNAGGAGTTPSITIDTLAPTVAITSSATALHAGQTATISFTFSEDPLATFTASDIAVSGGTLSGLTTTGLTRTALFTPTAGLASGTASITVASGSYTDAALNAGGAGTTPSITIDTLAPTVGITSSTSILPANQTATISFTFSEDPGSSFTASDIAVSGGTLSGLTTTGLIRTATFTPTISTGAATVTVANASYTDAAGNSGSAGTTPSIAITNLGPTVTVTALDISADTGTSNTDFITREAAQSITGTLSTALGAGEKLFGSVDNGSSWSDITSKVSGTAITWDGATLSGSSTIKLEVRNTAGYAGSALSQAYVLDTVPPTVAVTSDKSALKSGETATINFTFSEDPGSTFTAADLVIAGGTLGALGGSGLVRTATFTPTAALASGSASITVANASYTDVAGNTGSAGTTPSITIDTLAPTVSITSSTSAAHAGQTAEISFTFSEDPGSTFTAADLAIAGGTLGALGGSGLVRTATFTPTAGLASASASITVANASYTDAAGNTGSAGTTPSITIDTLAPTVSITSSTSAVHAGQTAEISFTFSEDPGSTFTAADLTIAGGTLGTLSGTGLVRTATFTPTADFASGIANITVANASYTDAAGNTGSAGTTPSITIDTLAPTVAITSSRSTLSFGQTAAISFTFSEDPGLSFTAADLTIAGGTLGTLSGSGLVRTATFTPTAGVASGTATISVANASYTDAAGNTGSAGTTPAISIHTQAPAVTISGLDISADTGSSDADFITSVAAQSITGMLGALLGAEEQLFGSVDNGASWSNITSKVSGTAINWDGATLSGSSTIMLEVRDAAGNAGSAVSQAYVLDTLPPTVAITSSASALHAGQTAQISFTFSEDPGSSFTPADLTVAGGTLGALGGSGLVRTATFTPAAGLASGSASITVANASYTDVAGNTGSTGTTPSIIIDTLAPTVAITSDKTTLLVGQTAAISFTFSEDPGLSFTAADLAIAGGTLGALGGSGLVRTATFTPTAGVNAGAASITIANASYTDTAGNSGSAGNTPSITFDTLAPSVAITSSTSVLSTGQTATITFTFSEDPGLSFTEADISTVNGALGALSGTGLTRTAIFTPTAGLASVAASITVANASYRDAAGNNGSAGITPALTITTTTSGGGDDGHGDDGHGDDGHGDDGHDGGSDTIQNKIISGNSRDNTLDGSRGNYTMKGGSGNDTYIVDSASDLVQELANQGTDTVKSSITYTLGVNVEYLMLTGSDGINGTGNTLANIIIGNSAGNILDGGVGKDSMQGGAGNDTYIVDNIGDVVKESVNQGIDRVESSVTWTLGDNVENLTLTGVDAINGTGNALANIINGNSARNILDGKAGVDTLNGGEGSDLYLVGFSSDHPSHEFADSGLSGIDEVRFTSTTAGTLTLYSEDTGIEKVVIGTGTAAAAVTTGITALNVNASAVLNALSITGNAGANSLTGTAFDDILDGGAGNDTLIGGAGNDILFGGKGNDILTGGTGSDSFVFNTAPSASSNRDTITDFMSGTDTLQFSKAVFTGLGALEGELSLDQFWSGAGVTTAHDSSDRIIYNTSSGALYYDADGAGGVAAVQVAIIGTSSHPGLHASDIHIIA